MQVIKIGIDLAKSAFQVHGVGSNDMHPDRTRHARIFLQCGRRPHKTWAGAGTMPARAPH
jgi:hypothetical protein